ncbi:MAG TPA: EVE domain-containing protein [Kofleriaceae bacterium]|nr:EVE domain-containing protein [Kofleriaceae bacterium]
MAAWLMKSEPGVYSIDDLARDRTTAWNGIRNYQARNLLRDQVAVGDQVLFYHSSADPPGVAGLARVARAGYPEKDPTWYQVDLEFVDKFARLVPLDELKQTAGLEQMMVTRKGARLSVQPVTDAEFKIVLRLARGGTDRSPRRSRS